MCSGAQKHLILSETLRESERYQDTQTSTHEHEFGYTVGVTDDALSCYYCIMLYIHCLFKTVLLNYFCKTKHILCYQCNSYVYHNVDDVSLKL